jgi:hypothetical protein
MAKWDIDKALQKLEPIRAAGTMIERAMVEVDVMKTKGVKPTPLQVEKGYGMLWCVGLGIMGMPKAFFYGQTIRQAFLRARKAAKTDKLAEYTPWGSQVFKPKPKERKKKSKRTVKA